MPMLQDHLDEEQRIMDERNRAPRRLDSETFDRPIRELCHWPVCATTSGATIGDTVRLMQQTRVGAVLVVDDGRMVGIVTERDVLMKVLGKIAAWESEPVTRIMTPEPTALHREDAIKFAVHQMHLGGYRHIPVLDEEGKPVHVISIRDVLGYVAEHFPRELMNVPPSPTRTSSPPDAPGS